MRWTKTSAVSTRLLVVVTSALMTVSPSSASLLAAEEPGAAGHSGVVSGVVWVDADGDGVRDEDEEGLSGVTMVLRSTTTGVVGTSPTDDNGLYQLTGASAGDHRVETLPSEGYAVSPIPESDEDVVNAFSSVDDLAQTEVFSLDAGTDLALNLGLVPTDDTTVDDESSETTTTTAPEPTTTTTESTTTTVPETTTTTVPFDEEALVGAQADSPPITAQAVVACTPEPGFVGCEAFTFSGGDQGFTVPDGVTSLNVKVWGAGGGGSIATGFDIGAPGGSGGYVAGDVEVTPGDQYVVMTGGGGGADGTPLASTTCDAAYGFGGACAQRTTGGYIDGGGGGGLSGLFTGAAPVTETDQSRALLVAGGGGAGEGTTACDNMSAAGGAGGNGFAGTMPTMQGEHGAFTNAPPIFGSDPTGGGGGYFGGEGTDRLRDDICVRSANGGSNFVAAEVTDPVDLAGNEADPVPQFTVNDAPNNTDPHYISGVGVGEMELATPGGDGLVVLQWAEPAQPAACNLSVNGSFEDPNIQGHPDAVYYPSGDAAYLTSIDTISGWNVVGGTVDILRWFNNASDGSQSIDMWGTAAATVEQTFTGLIPGVDYTFSLDYSGLSATNSIATVSLDTGSGFTDLQTLAPAADGTNNGSPPPGGQVGWNVTWSTFPHTFTATSTSATIRITNQAAPSTLNTGLFIDNFVFGAEEPCEDFGDAPTSYGTLLADNGPRHEAIGYDPATNTASLMLGGQVSIENDGQPSVDADADDFDDGVFNPIEMLPGQPTTVTVNATNTSGGAATLVGWIDLDNDGTFEDGEWDSVPVPDGSNAQDFDLTFDPATFVGDGTHARFRLFPGTVADPEPIGPASAGEVEDYTVSGPFPEPWACGTNEPGLLFQSDVQTEVTVNPVDLLTGDYLNPTVIPGSSINATGYNIQDNYVYGWSIQEDELVVIGSDGSAIGLGQPAGMTGPHFIGDVDDNGHYWTYAGGTWYDVDLATMTVDSGTSAQPTGVTDGLDWAFIPGTNSLWRVVDLGGQAALLGFNRTSHTWTTPVPLANMTPGNYGAVFVDADGFLYASHNDSGEIWRVDVGAETADPFAQGQPASGNDGARCFNSQIVIDFGDAPDSYGTLLADAGPRHGIPGYDAGNNAAPLMLGTSVDIETDGQPSAVADGDGADEDGVADQIVMIIGEDTDVEVVVTNTSGEPATLAGWIDLNDDGVFDAGELQWVVVPSGGTTTETLTFPAVGLPADGSFARFRLFPGVVDAADLSPTGSAAAGEVEDYPVVGPVAIFLECPNVYALQGGSPYNIYEVDTATGDMTIVGQNAPGSGTANGMGISADARYVFSHRSGEVLRYDTHTGLTDTFPGVGGFNATHGGVDPSSGIYYYGNISSGNIYAFDPGTETNLGQVAELSFDIAPAGNNGDWSFDAQGNMYVVAGSTATSSLYVVSGLPTTSQGTPVTVTGEQITTFSTSGAAVNGIAFDATGSLFAASNAVIFEINPSTGAIINSETLDPSGVSVDLASCATPSTIVVQKDIVDRFVADDQFEVTVTGGGIAENNVGTTEGSDTGLQTDPAETAGPVLGLPGTTYDIAETGVSGADLANYTSSWVCVNQTDGGAIVAEGTGVSGAFTMPDSINGVGAAIVCTFDNESLPLDLGDAPDTYGTTLALNGPRHGVFGYDPDASTAPVMLGSSIDVEADGQPSAAADGDGVDEDGVTFNSTLGYPSPTLRTGLDPVSLQPVENTLEVDASVDGFVSVWVDWNQDGDFDDAGEQVANAEAVTPGLNDITLAQGTNPDDISTYVRVRYSTDEGSIATPYGLAPDGEVEDYQVLIERLNQPDACTDTGTEYYSFTFSQPITEGTTGGVGDNALYENVSVINGLAVDMFVEVIAGDLKESGAGSLPPNGLGVGSGGAFGTDDAQWQVDQNATLRYTFYEAGTTTPVAINGAFTINDMDGPPQVATQETATFDVGDLTSYAVTQGSLVTISQDGGDVTFEGHGANNGNPESRFQVVVESISTFDVEWNGFSGSGFGFDGDGDLSIDPPACEDWGDAPDSYGTTAAANGPNHTIVPGLLLGSEIDFDVDGQPSPGADGDDLNRLDDEDGVDINPGIPGSVMVGQAGGLNTAEVTVTGSGFLSAWIDFDQNGVFDPGEAIFDDEPVVDGLNTLDFAVPITAPHGETYARFRLTSQEDVADTPTGPAADGEVEDYVIHITAPVSQACEAGLINSGFEEPLVNGPTPFIQQFSGGRIKTYHENVVPGWSFVAADPTAGTEEERNAIEIWRTPNPAAHEGAQFAEINAYVFGYLYQEMVTTPGTTLTWQFAHRGRAGADTIALNIGAPGATVQQTTETTGNTAWQVYTGQYVVPAGQFITRFEFEAIESATGNSAAGNFLDAIQFGVECPTDFGDAPDSYGTSLTSDGARHEISAYDDAGDTADLMLGSAIDSELDGAPGIDADGDDVDDVDVDDEDGVSSPIEFVAGVETSVDVVVTNDTGDVATLAGWIDLDGNGAFDANERSQTLVTVPANTTGTFTLTFDAGTTTDDTYARFRLFSGTEDDPQATGLASGGEVEDYLVPSGLVHYQKTVTPDDLPVLQPGDIFTYTVTVSNLGSIPLTDLSFTDDLSGVVGDGDAIYNSDITVVSGPGTAAFNAPGEIVWDLGGDTLAVGAQAVVEYSVTIADPPAGDAILINGVLGTGPGSNCTDDPPTDPDCFVEIPQPLIEGVKTSDAAGEAEPGETVAYEFTVTNVGPGAANNAVVWDDLSGVLDDASFNITSLTLDPAGQGQVSFDAANERLVWNGPLDAAGDPLDSVTITYTVTVNEADDMGDGIMQNALLMTGCPNPPIFDIDDPDFDPDCVEIVEVPAWTVDKSSDALDPVVPGQTINYTITVENTGGVDLAAADVLVEDDLTGVLDDAVYNGDATAATGTVSYSQPLLTWNGPLTAGQTATLTYSVTVNDATELGDGQLLNAVTGGDCPDPAITDPQSPDFDPDCVNILDVEAWTAVKTSDAVGNVEPGDTVSYTITVENTGNVALTAVNVDDLTEVLDDASYDGNADDVGHPGTFDFTSPTLTWSGDLAVDETVTLTYSVTVNDATDLGDGQLVNAITGPTNCPDPAITDPDDTNFDPDCVNILDVEAWSAVKTSDAAGNVEPGDTVNYTITVENTGNVDLLAADVVVEDDLTEVLDDASYDGNVDQGATYAAPVITWSADVAVDDVVVITYSVTVNDATDLGDGELVNAITGPPNCPDPAITDPADSGFDPDCVNVLDVEAWTAGKTSDAAGTVQPGDTVNYTITVENTGNVALTAINVDDLTEVLDDASYDGNAADGGHAGNFDFTSPELTWTGDLAVDEQVTLTYSVTINDATELGDGELVNAITGPTNCPDPAITDPTATGFDPDCVNILDVEAWTAVKSSDAVGNVLPGDTVEYTITVENTGNVALSAVDVVNVDDLTEVLDDATYDGNAADGGHAGTFDFTTPTLTWSGDLAVDEVVTLTYSVTINDADDLGDGQLVNALTGSTNCPDPAITDPADSGFDPDCVNILEVAAYTVVKTSDAVDPVLPGDEVEYTLTVTNTGNVDLTGPDAATFDDDLSGVLDDATFNDDESADVGTATFSDPEISWAGDLGVDDVATITYSVTVDQPIGGDHQLANAVVGGDCPDPAITDPNHPDFDETCVVVDPLPGVDITKVIFGDPVEELQPGDTFEYVVTVENIGQVDLVGETFADDLSEVLDDAELDQSSMTADIGTVNFADPELTWIGDLDIGQTATVRYSVTIDDPITGDAELRNAVVGPIYSNCVPPDATDPDCWEETPLPNVHVSKELVGPANPQPGDTVTYRITVENRGGATAIDEEISDDLSGVLDDSSYNADASPTSGTVYSEPTLTWSGDIPAGEVVTITYTVTVNHYLDLGDANLENAVTGGENCPDADECTTRTALPTYAAAKTKVSPDQVAAGDVVTYEVAITNTSDVTAESAEVIDDLSGVLDDAVYNDDATAATGTVNYSQPLLTWNGSLTAGQTVTVTYSVTVNPGDQLADGVLENTVTAPNCGETPDLPTLSNHECATLDLVGAVQYNKAIVSPEDSITSGDVVTYQVTVANTGAADLTGLSFTDDLSDVLVHSAFQHDQQASTGTATYQSGTLTWTGDLAAGQTATVTYSVRLHDDAPVGSALNNKVVGNGPGSNCPSGSANPDCLAVMVLSATSLPFTGADIIYLVNAALGILGLGVLLTMTTRRRREG
jgi:fimbrial isopeptide formation D2 family protein/uncharacterized repeat protein (TIGR01451 family)